MHDASKAIGEFLAATAAKKPTPGGGAATALVGALAASLGEMVINYSLGKKGLEAFDAELRSCLAELEQARDRLLGLMADDQQAYQAMAAARKQRGSGPDGEARYQAAVNQAVHIPQAVAEAGRSILNLCDRLVLFVNPMLLSDLAIAADLAMACVRCSAYNVQANLGEMSDETTRRANHAATNKLLSESLKLIQNASPRIWERHRTGV